MTYSESADLMIDLVFRGRIKVAITKFATYIFTEDPVTQGHNARYRWGQQTVQNPDAAAGSLQPLVVMDPQVQTDGAAISDEALQAAVEAIVNKIA
jgi:hypothetical protein